MKIGIIGAGTRSTAYTTCIANEKEHAVTAICDIDEKRLEAYSKLYFTEGSTPELYTDFNELLKSDIDAVIICTPDYVHTEPVLMAMNRSKHIILEKPIASNPTDAKIIYDAAKNYDKVFALGFVLRYTGVYKRVKEIVDSGTLGRIVTIQASELLSRTHSSSFCRRWHRYTANSGGMMNTKCCHDIDILNYILGSEPKAVASFGGRKIYVENKSLPLHCCDCPAPDKCIYSFNYKNYGKSSNFSPLQDLCVYNSKKDINDYECMLIKYENDVICQFELCMFNAYSNREMSIHGSSATLQMDFVKRTVKVSPLKGESLTYTLEESASGHGGGDSALVESFLASCQSGNYINDAKDGYLASLTAFACEKSINEGRIINLDTNFAE